MLIGFHGCNMIYLYLGRVVGKQAMMGMMLPCNG